MSIKTNLDNRFSGNQVLKSEEVLILVCYAKLAVSVILIEKVLS